MKECIIIILLGTSAYSWGQDANAILNKIVAQYQSDQTIAYTMTYRFYEDLNTAMPSDSMRFDWVMQQEKTYMQTEELTLLQIGDQQLIVDAIHETIMLQQGINANPYGLKQTIDLALSMGLSLITFEATDGLKGIAFVAPEQSNTRIALHYDPSSYLIQYSSILIDVQNGAYQGQYNQTRFEAHYSNYKRLDRFPYSLSQFVQRKGSTWQGIGKYKTYLLESYN